MHSPVIFFTLYHNAFFLGLVLAVPDVNAGLRAHLWGPAEKMSESRFRFWHKADVQESTFNAHF
jgi:hypothetical protein